MKRALICFGVIFVFCALMCSGTNAQDSGKDWKGEFAGDKAAMKDARDAIKSNAEAARQEEQQLREQIRAAEQSGDMATAQQLRAQLKAAHQANVQEMHQDKQALKSARQELRHDKKEARHEGVLPPRMDKDNNPPGPRGGRGTNWENPPGPKGGPGASPDRRGGRR